MLVSEKWIIKKELAMGTNWTEVRAVSDVILLLSLLGQKPGWEHSGKK